MARGLSCPVACGILVPRPGIEPASPALQDGFLTTGPPEKSLCIFLYMSFWCTLVYISAEYIPMVLNVSGWAILAPREYFGCHNSGCVLLASGR